MKTTLRQLTVAWPLVIFLLLPALTRAETAVQAWVQRYNGPGDGIDCANALAVDGNNDVIVTGYSTNSPSGYDYATIKYSSAGVPLWTNFYNGPENGFDFGYALAVDGNNDVIVTGCSSNSVSGYDYATIKYSSVGVPLWSNRYNGPGNGNDYAYALAVDGNNDVIVTGQAANSASGYDYATIKYSSAGMPLWTNLYKGPGNGDDYCHALAVDGNNDVIVAGASTNSASSLDYATIKYSSAGVPLWTNFYNGPGNGNDVGYALAVDADNDVVVTGRSVGGATGNDYATIKYTSAGVPLWTNRFNGLDSGPNDVAVDGNKDVIVIGSSYGSGGSYGYATIKYSSAGVPLWTNRYNGPGYNHDRAYAVAVDGSNNVIVTGYSYSSLNYSTSDYTTIKYSSTGVPLWTNFYGGLAGHNFATAIALDDSGNVIVTGSSSRIGSGDDLVTIKYICVPSPVLTGLQLTNGTFQLRVDGVLRPGTLVIEATTNLSTTNWAGVFTNTTPTNVLFYTDPDASNAPTRFYRTFQFP